MENIINIGCGEYMVYYVTDLGNVYTYLNNNLIKLPTGTSKIIRAVGGLHIGAALDSDGNVWTMGSNIGGQMGNGTTGPGSDTTPYKIVKDINGNPFTGIVQVEQYMGTDFALKMDGTVWIWGDDNLGVGASYAPKQIVFPTKIAKIAATIPLMALDNSGVVWEWKYKATTPTKVTLSSTAADIAGCHTRVEYAIVNGYPYGWGGDAVYTGQVGYQGSYWNPMTIPAPLKDLWGLKSPIVKLVCNSNTTHFIDTNGDLWGLGDNVQGEVGNGQEIDWGTYKNSSGQVTPYTYSWDWAKYELMILKPVQILPGVKFKDVLTGGSYAFYNYAQDTAGNWYSWGRNKYAVLGNGITIGPNENAIYPNLLDVTTPTKVTPLTTPIKVLTLAQTGKYPFAGTTTTTTTSTTKRTSTTTSTSTTKATTTTSTSTTTSTTSTTSTSTTSTTTTTTTTRWVVARLYNDMTWEYDPNAQKYIW